MLSREQVMQIMRDRQFTFNMESRDGQGNVTAFYFLSEAVYHRRHKEQVTIPPFSCKVIPNSDEFQFTYAVPKSINKLETPVCGSFMNDGHFFKICSRFEDSVRVLYEAFGD